MTTFYTVAGEEFALMQCGNCGVRHLMPRVKYEECKRHQGHPTKRLNDIEFWHCPNGHQRQFVGERVEDIERARADKAEQAAEQARADALAERARREKVEREAARMKKRAAAGVCPCCNRTFVALGRHMKTKHPDFSGAVMPMKRPA